MAETAFYTQALHGPYRLYDAGRLALEDGGEIGNLQLAYATFGTLSPARDNAILVATWFSGTSKIIEQAYVGPGRALDPEKYFIVLVNQIGSGLSSSPHNTPAPHGGANFPRVRIGDDVRAQHRLITEEFGIDTLALVTGASMGAEQTYEWAVRYPQMVRRAAPIAGTARTTAHTGLFAQTLMDAITDADASEAGLRLHARLWAVMGSNPAMYRAEAWRALGFGSAEEFVAGLLEASFVQHDPGNLLAQAWKWQQADVSRHAGGDLAAALGRITAKTMVMPIDTDMFFTPADCQAEQRLIPGSTLRTLHTVWGHIGVMGMDPALLAQIDDALKALLDS